jgi:hypothetical protein
MPADWGLPTIEHAFSLDYSGPGLTPDQIPIPETTKTTKQDEPGRRLTDMHAPMRQIAYSALRLGVMVALAMLLILGLLPAVLAVQAAST